MELGYKNVRTIRKARVPPASRESGSSGVPQWYSIGQVRTYEYDLVQLASALLSRDYPMISRSQCSMSRRRGRGKEGGLSLITFCHPSRTLASPVCLNLHQDDANGCGNRQSSPCSGKHIVYIGCIARQHFVNGQKDQLSAQA